MVAGTIARVLNTQKLNRKLARLPDVSKEEMRLSLAVSAREMADMMEVLVPKDSGKLAGSIGWTFGEPPKGSIAAGMLVDKAGAIVATVYAGDKEAYYAKWVEFGTRKMSPQPFFFVAYRALKKRAKSRIKRGQTKAVKKVAAT